MIKIIYIILAVIFSSTISLGQSFTYEPAQNIYDTTWADSFSSTDMDITNNTGMDITMEWKVLENSVGGKAWDNTLCTNLGCFSVMPANGSFGLIKKGKIAYFKSHVKYNNEVRTGKLIFLVWDKNDPSISDTVSFNYTAIKTTGIHDIGSQKKTKLFPSVVQNDLHLSFAKNTGSKELMIYSLSGEKLWTDQNSNDFADINVQVLKSGIYILLIRHENGGVESFKFIKQ